MRFPSSSRTGKREKPVRAAASSTSAGVTVTGQRLQAVGREQDRARVALLELQRADEDALLVGVQQPLAARLRHEPGDLVARERARHLVAHRHADELEQAAGRSS